MSTPTPEERATDLFDSLIDCGMPSYPMGGRPAAEKIIAAAIREAEAVEREICAQIVLNHRPPTGCFHGATCEQIIANGIRARSNP